MDETAWDAQRQAILQALQDGLPTRWRERAYTDEQVRRLVAELQDLPPEPLSARLSAAGFTLRPHVDPEAPDIEQSCRTCMYFEAHHRYCNLPELKLGVEPDWSCVLWRV